MFGLELNHATDVTGNIRIWDTTQATKGLKFEMRALAGRINDLDWTEDSKVWCGVLWCGVLW